MIDKQRASGQEQRVFMRTGDDVHFAGHSCHQIVRRVFHFQNDGVTLRVRIGRGLNRRDVGGKSLRAIGVELHLRLHFGFHFTDVFFVHFAADVSFAR